MASLEYPLKRQPSNMDYLVHVLILIAIYAILAMSLDILAGQTGLLSVAHAGFFGLGAYTSALFGIHFQLPFLGGILAGMAVAVLISFIVSLPSLRLHDDYFVIATFAFQMILFNVFNNWIDLTGGPTGIAGIPQPEIFGFLVDTPVKYVGVAGVFVAIVFGLVAVISKSPFGRVLRAVREDEIFAQSVGKNTVRFKVIAFAVSAGLAAISGSLYAHYITYIDPTNFTVTESILVISMLIIGGVDSLWGPILGAAILVSLPEGLRFVGLPSSVAANLREIFYGSLLVVMMMTRPNGILGRYRLGL